MTPTEAEALSEEKLAQALAAAVKAKDASLPEALARSTIKAVARAAKKALYQLKSSGVAVAVESPKGEQPKLTKTAEELPALLSAIAGTGERALFFAKARQGGGLDTWQAVVHDSVGILQLERGETQRSKYRRHLEQIRQTEPSVMEAPMAQALEELGIAWSQSVRAKNPLPPDADSQLRRLGVVPIDGWPPLPPRSADDASLEQRATSLHDEREIASWLPGAEQVKVLSNRLDEVDTSPLQLTEVQKREQRMQKVLMTAGEVSAEERKIWAMRLWRSASIFEKSGREEKGRIARAEARLLFHEAKLPSRFIERMFEKVLLLAERAQAAQAAQGEPGPAPPEKTSPGGLIVP